MKTIEEVKQEYAYELGFDSWHEYTQGYSDITDADVNEIAKRYSNQFV